MGSPNLASDFGTVLATRGQGVDACHWISVAVVDSFGKLLSRAGDPEWACMTRSSIKAFQALPLVTSGAADRFGLGFEELAIAQASHNGADEHVRWVQSLLAKAQATPSDLRCGAHLPLFMQHEKRWPTAGEDQDPLRHNCSGKHAGFLVLARHLGVPFEHYLDRASALQLAVRDALANYAGLEAADLALGTDGCSAPNYALPLRCLARAFAAYASAPAEAPLGRLKQALLQFPELVSGEGQFDLALMQALPGQLVCKAGAEAILALGIVERGIGVVIKVHDGNPRALPPACLAVLTQLGLFPGGIPAGLVQYQRPTLLNARGIATGELIAEVGLE